jgi:uncharacterized membrane protein YdjX (TVP38/TMEM64 family)
MAALLFVLSMSLASTVDDDGRDRLLRSTSRRENTSLVSKGTLMPSRSTAALKKQRPRPPPPPSPSPPPGWMALPQYDVDAICDHLSEHENCSIAVTWHNATAAVAPAHVTNTSIGVNVRIAPGFAVLGVRIRRPGPVALIALYTAINVCVTSLIPVPIATTLVPVATLCWGFVGGILVNVLSTCIGAYLGLVLTRHACRPRLLRLLGRHRGRWEALDASLAKHGWTIPLLIRCNTASPIVLTNVLLALTSLPSRTYLWTTFVGEVFTSFPFAYATYVRGHSARKPRPRVPCTAH